MRIEDLQEMNRLGILELRGEDDYVLSKEFKKRCQKIGGSWTTAHFNKVVSWNKKVRQATNGEQRMKVVIWTQVLMAFFIEHKELQKMMKNNDLTLKKRLADYCTIIELLEGEEDEETFENIVRY